MNFVMILLYIFLIYMIIRTILLQKANKRLRGIIDLVKMIDDEQGFLTRAQEEIDAAPTEEMKTKYQVLKLWGLATYGHMDEYDELLPEINTALLFQSKQQNDDSLFYMLLAIPNILQVNRDSERADALIAKVESEVENAGSRMDVKLAHACNDAYFDRNDKGMDYFRKLMDGDYEGEVYAKNLISLYKEIVGTMLYKAYTITPPEDSTEIDEARSLAEAYNETRIGTTWLKNIGVVLESEENQDTDTEENTDSRETADQKETSAADTDTAEPAEEKNPEESVSSESESGDVFTEENKE